MLPDLEGATDIEIVPENIHAVQAIYAAYLLEEARLFQVVERIAELFGQWLLPMGRDSGSAPATCVGLVTAPAAGCTLGPW